MLVAWLFATAAIAQQGSAGDAVAIAAAIMAADTQPVYLGNKQCRRCHRSPLEDDVRDFITYQESQPFLRSDNDQEEDKLIFHGKDKHADAFALLMEARGAAMTDRLKMTDTSKYQRGSPQHVQELVNNAQGCLTCHADWRADRDLSPAFKKMVEHGVACEACHGPSSLWEDPHKRIEWRTKSSADKQALGMIDVRNPITRARQCFSCHIGNAE
ncbi:MAG: hypothetical protein GTO26_09475, partial [Planctomycetales bacterium]|nr:hypothetical protein [Planctomycetales bacterium]